MKINNDPVYINLDPITGEVTGNVYTGSFKVKKYLRHDEKTTASRLAETWALNIERDPRRFAFLSTLAHLSLHIVEAPDWWIDSGIGLYDEEPVWKLAELITGIQRPREPEKVNTSEQSEQTSEAKSKKK